MTKKTLKALLLTFCIFWEHPTVSSQTHSEPMRYDIIISEIMAKPSPKIGLPAVEYIELHNRLPHPVALQNWRLSLGNTNKKLPDIELDSCGYAVLIAQKYLEDFASLCDHIYLLSSLSITDAGQVITLFNPNDEVIHHVSFKPSWHSEKIKQEGGWSLEMIDENWPCAGRWNWDSSTDPLGGTPGRPNSIRNTLSDNTSPSITGVTLLDSFTLRVHFSKSVMNAVPIPSSLFRTEPPLTILDITEVPPKFASVDVHLANTPDPNSIYHLFLEGDLSDCGGLSWHVCQRIPFGRASLPEYNDLIINEILSNSIGDENADYLEIYNRSDKIIDLKDVKVGYGGNTLPQKAVSTVSKGHQILPKTYVALCKQKSVTLEQYNCKDEQALIECDSLPDFAIANGVVHLTDRSLQSIDRLAYSEEMHYAKLLTTKGVALERLHADHPTQDENNWRSAAESAGYGTPGYQNSQACSQVSAGEFEVSPEVFSPDNDGFEDYTEVYCLFSDGEYRVNIVVYDSRGNPVKHLANNVLCGSSTAFRWDGLNDNGQSAPAGMYVVQIECWDLRIQKTLRKRKVVSIFR